MIASNSNPKKKGRYVVVIVHNNHMYTLCNPKRKLKYLRYNFLCPCHSFAEKHWQDVIPPQLSTHSVKGADLRYTELPLAPVPAAPAPRGKGVTTNLILPSNPVQPITCPPLPAPLPSLSTPQQPCLQEQSYSLSSVSHLFNRQCHAPNKHFFPKSLDSSEPSSIFLVLIFS